MALFLVQHAKSLPKELDPERGLSAEGRAEAERMAALAKASGLQVRRIRHSGKMRAQQTAEVFAAALVPPQGVEAVAGINPGDAVESFAPRLKPQDDLMLVGHLPFLEKLAAYLLTGDAERIVVKFQNAGVVCLDQAPDSPRWFVKWALVPTL